jgi:hypothetical protein
MLIPVLPVPVMKNMIGYSLIVAVYSVDDDPGFRDVDPPVKQAIRVRA